MELRAPLLFRSQPSPPRPGLSFPPTARRLEWSFFSRDRRVPFEPRPCSSDILRITPLSTFGSYFFPSPSRSIRESLLDELGRIRFLFFDVGRLLQKRKRVSSSFSSFSLFCLPVKFLCEQEAFLIHSPPSSRPSLSSLMVDGLVLNRGKGVDLVFLLRLITVPFREVSSPPLLLLTPEERRGASPFPPPHVTAQLLGSIGRVLNSFFSPAVKNFFLS